MKNNERLQALTILQQVIFAKIPLTPLLQAKPAESSLTKAICFGVCRHYFQLEQIADSMLKKRPQEPAIWLALLIGLYQLQFMAKPEYAVVKETVELLQKLKLSWAKGLVNAILRRYCREKVAIKEQLTTSIDYTNNHPQWLVEKIKHDWPSGWQTILHNNDQQPPMSLRVNQRKISRDDYLAQLQAAGIEAQAQVWSADGITVAKPCDVQDLPGFAAGDVSIQDEAGQLVVTLLALQPGLRLLDACCAPGGKTCHILETQPQLGQCVAIDNDDRRLKRVAENLTRLNLQAQVQCADAAYPESWWDGQLFDRILLDAPCSAVGVIRRHPDIKLLRTVEEVETAVNLQAHFLQQLWPLLGKGGLLVYATCSILKQENELQIKQFVEMHPDCQVEKCDKPWAKNSGYGWQILPGQDNCDGFFYSVLYKK